MGNNLLFILKKKLKENRVNYLFWAPSSLIPGIIVLGGIKQKKSKIISFR
jgi:hypothetical protein